MNLELFGIELKAIRSSKQYKDAIKLLQETWDTWADNNQTDQETEAAIWSEWIAGLEPEIREEVRSPLA